MALGAVRACLAQIQSCEDVVQVAAHKHVVCSFHSNVCARADCNAHVCGRQRRRVIHAVAHHCYAAPVRLLQRTHLQQGHKGMLQTLQSI